MWRRPLALAAYATTVARHNNQRRGGQVGPLVNCGLADHLAAQLTEQIATGVHSHVAPWLSTRSVGGAVNDIDPAATAYPHPLSRATSHTNPRHR
jgi:hypothetical protein